MKSSKTALLSIKNAGRALTPQNNTFLGLSVLAKKKITGNRADNMVFHHIAGINYKVNAKE